MFILLHKTIYIFIKIYSWLEDVRTVFPGVVTSETLGHTTEGRPIQLLKVIMQLYMRMKGWAQVIIEMRDVFTLLNADIFLLFSISSSI